MKPKYRQITRLLPASICIAASLPFVAQAGIYFDNTSGDATPTPADNGATTIIANGGTNIINPSVTIAGGVLMTGHVGDMMFPVAETEVLEITAANYTVTNAGILSGTDHHGINSSFNFILSNSGTIAGGIVGGRNGVLSAAAATVTNNFNGTIIGTEDGIHFVGNGGSVTNYGTISGGSAGSSDGIRGRDNLEVYNKYNNSMSGGSITGRQYGISANNNLLVVNEYQASITATNGDAVFINNGYTGGSVTNYGTITATGSGSSDGIRGRNGLTVNNNTVFNFTPIAGGSITGSQYGIYADDDLTVTNQNLASITGSITGINAGNGGAITTNVTNSGTITGLAGDGVRGLDSFVLINHMGGVITGTGGTGVWLDDDATVTNDGTISGTNSGIRVSEGSTVTNSGTISSAGMGIDVFGSGNFFTLNNTGTITGSGGTAIDGVLNGVDTLNLDPGSIINGNIILNSGADNIYMTSDSDDSSIVNGNINGGTGTDVLTFDGGRTDQYSTTNIVNGDVTFMQDIIKNGSGTAFIGDEGGPLRTVQTDAVNVNSGGLYINGNVNGSIVGQTAIANNTGHLGGTGTWNAIITLTNGAIITPGQTALNLTSTVANSVGALTVTGNVSLDATSAYVWNATPAPSTALVPGVTSDLITLAGVGNVFTTTNSDFVIAPTNVNTPLLNGSTIVVDTDDTLIGAFSSISVGAFPSTTPDNGTFVANQINPILAANFTTLSQVNANQDWMLTITHNYSQFGSTPNQVAAGNMLDGLVNTATGNLAQLLAALDYSSAQTTSDTLAALDPGSFLASAAGLVSNNYHLHRTVENHNAAVRAGWGAVSAPVADPSAKGAVVAAPTGCAGTRNVWGSFSYDWQDLSTGNSAFDQDGETTSFTAGIDFTVSQNFRLGLVAEGSQSSWDGNGNLGSDIDSYRIAGYANWGAATGWYVDALVGYNSSSVDQSRLVSMGNNIGTQSGGYDADGWQGMITVGNTIATSAGMFSPFIGLELQQLSSDSFTATGSALPIGLSSFDIDSIRGLIGVKWEADIAQKLKAYASLAYAYEFQGDAPTTTVSFGGGSYTASGMDLGDSVLLSTGMRWNVATCTTVDFGYRGEFALDDGLDSHGANIGVNFSF